VGGHPPRCFGRWGRPRARGRVPGAGDSTRASIWHDRIKVSEVCQEVEERYGLTVVDGRTAWSKPGATRAEDEKGQAHERSGAGPGPAGAPGARGQRHRRATKASSSGDFALMTAVPAPVATGGQDFVVGYSVAAGGSSSKSVWFGGGRLAKDLTLPTLRAGWRSIDDQGAAWRADADGGGR
jgi:hypothetical protein